MNRKDYVTFHTAKLLEAAGYPQNAHSDVKVYVLTRNGGYAIANNADLTSPNPQRVVAPHLWDAMEWLREERKIHIEIIVWSGVHPYLIGVYRLETPTNDIAGDTGDYYTYEQACDAGVAAACEWLAKNN